MKLTLALFAVLAIIGLGQAHQVPDFGSGPLHEDIQDILDLVPMKGVATIFLDYLTEDAEFQDAINRLQTSKVLKDLMIQVEAIPEVINFFNFLQKEGIEIYVIINKINKLLDIKDLVPPISYHIKSMKRTGGVLGFFKDAKALFNYDDFIRIYVEKMQNSPAFVRYVEQLKSDNFQQIVNKVCLTKPFQLILNTLEQYGVNMQIVADIMYIVLGITVPKIPPPSIFYDRSLFEELRDFWNLIPEEFIQVMSEYVTKDEKVQTAFHFILEPEFHELLRKVEALKEHQAVVIYLEKSGLHAIDVIKIYHDIIGMDKYVPPKIEDKFESHVGVQKVGDGLKAMLNDLLAVAPVEELNALYYEKMKTPNAFSDFVKIVTSPEMKKLLFDLYAHPTYRDLINKCLDKGLDLKAIAEFDKKLIPIPIPIPE